MSTRGKPSELHPRVVANELGLNVRGGPIEWADVLDAAVQAYWDKRTQPAEEKAA